MDKLTEEIAALKERLKKAEEGKEKAEKRWQEEKNEILVIFEYFLTKIISKPPKLTTW